MTKVAKISKVSTQTVEVVDDKTVTIDGHTHEILRVKAFESKGKRSIKSLIAEAVKAKFGSPNK